MKRILNVAAPLAFVLALAGGQAWAQQQPTAPAAKAAPDCAAMWTAADLNKDGSLVGDELKAYTTVLSTIDTDKDGKLSRVEFDTACKANRLPART